MELSFFIIDDLELDSFVAKKYIEGTVAYKSINIFVDAGQALDYIQNDGKYPDYQHKTIVLLDILMPLMSGFEFMETFESLPDNIKERYIIIAITTSLNNVDILKIKSYPSVKEVLKKPVTMLKINKILKQLEIV